MMEISATQQGQVTVVKIVGTVDAMTAGSATAFLEETVQGGNVHIVTDLTDVDYMSSAGLRTLLTTLKATRQVEGDLRIANPQDAVLKVFNMAGLTSVLDIYDDVDSAVKSYE